MTVVAWVLLGVAAAAAVIDWVSVVRGSKPLEYFAKPATTIALLGVALAVDPAHHDVRVWFAAALVASLVGDVFLMVSGDRFVFGLGSFLVAQVLFTIGFSLHAGTATEYVVGVAIVSVLSTVLCSRFIRALRRAGRTELVVPVVCYMLAIAAMVASAIASGNVYAIVGALLFMASDSWIAENRFVEEHRWGQLVIMVTYHAALAGLVVSLV